MKDSQNESNGYREAISIIIPVVNEERNIKPLVERTDLALKSREIKYELIFIDDRSTDNTVRILKKLQKEYPISVYEKKGKKGKAYSLIEGFARAKYELVAMIDADLQYPPEAIPAMVEKIDEKISIVVANRVKSTTSILRRLVSRMFLIPFGKFLHGFDCDVQSGLKVFKREIVERIKLNPGPWSFDLEFLVKARNAAYKVDSVDIVFDKRHNEKAKISLIPAALEIGISALKLKFKPADIVPFPGGFHYNGIKFIHHTDLPERESAVRSFTTTQKMIIFGLFFILLAGLLINWIATVTVVVATLTLIYFSDLFFNLFLIIRSFSRAPEINITAKDFLSVKNSWPSYTILCPLYREWEVLPQFVTAISRLDYPKDKLQVLLLLEEDDKETIKHAQSYDLPSYFKIVVVPDSLPKTKPKALNYGLKQATGEYVVIYDAEDVPEPKQLKKAVLAFKKTDKRTVCIQAKLNFYNPHHNILTRIFTAEYSVWFDLVLTGLQSIVAPIPLGGTSNHFRRSDLHKLKGWDSFNVTEDCDLGVRLVKHGYKTALMNSLTLEEANSNIKNWFRQRTRWIKGYLQTYLVHMRNPKELAKDWKEPHLLTFQLIVGGKILSMFINPFMWVTTILYFAFRSSVGVFIQQFFPAPVLYMGVFSLVFGNFLYMYYYMVGSAKRNHYEIIKYVFLVPFYWLAMSIAAWLALIQLIRRPHYWPKTIHGFHFDSEKAFNQATETIGKRLVDTRLISYPVNFNPTYAQAKKVEDKYTWSKKSISSGSILLAAMMGGNFINFLYNAYLGRTISFEDFGLITLINSFWFILSIFVGSLGTTVNHRVAYLTAKVGPEGAKNFFLQIAKKILVISGIFTVVWLLASPLLANFFRVQSMIPIIIFAPLIILAAVESISEGFLNGSFAFLAIAVIILFTGISKLLTAIILVHFKFDQLTYLAIPISIFASFIIAFSLVLLKIRKIKIKTERTYSSFPKRFYTASIMTGFSTTAFLTIDVLLAKHFLSPTLAGEYAFLSLIGKMIYYFGSILNVFITPFVSRDLGANRDPKKSFYRLLAGTVILTSGLYFTIGIFGRFFIPILFGAKAYAILDYLSLYSLAISIFVISNSIIAYHLIRHHYSFPAFALFISAFMWIGISLFHSGIGQITQVLFVTSLVSFAILIFLHLLQRNEKFLLKNIIDLFGLFLPLPKTAPQVMSGKRILVFNWRDTKHVFAGGAEVYIHELAKRWVKAGNSVTLFCGNDSHCLREEMIDGVQVIRRGGFYFVYIWSVFYYLLRFRGHYDVVIDSENGIPFFTPLFVKENKFLLIHHVHQEVFLKSLKPPFSWLALFLELRLMPFVYQNIQAITVSPSSKKDILDKQLTTVDPVVVYNGVDLNRFKPGLKSEVPLVLYLGRLKQYKSLNVFIHAAKRILNKIPKTRFIIAGDGEEKESLIRLAKKIGVLDKIEFLGKVSEEEKISLYQKAWVFVNPSLMEGWGITTIEANACGTPVVASNVPGLRDSVDNPHSGFLVPHGDVYRFSERILSILRHEDIRIKLSLVAILWAQKFDWQKSADKSLELFK